MTAYLIAFVGSLSLSVFEQYNQMCFGRGHHCYFRFVFFRGQDVFHATMYDVINDIQLPNREK